MRSFLLVVALVAVGCASNFQHGPLGPAKASSPITVLAERFRAKVANQAQQRCRIVYVGADGLVEVWCEDARYQECLDPRWPYALTAGGEILECGTLKRKREQ